MLLISDAQMQALEAARFQDWLGVHLRRFFPEECRALSGTALASRIEVAVARAQSYGFRGPADVCRYLDVMFALGPDFEADDALRWAGEILDDPAITDMTARMDALEAATREHLATVARESAQGERQG